MMASASTPAKLAQDPAYDNFFMRLGKKNTDSESHKKVVETYSQFWDDKENLGENESAVAARRQKSDVITNQYYDLATDFYEYGWGTSFHFARMFKGSSFAQNISRHEDYLALKLNLKEGMRCLDVGCGVGGPLREIASFSGAHVTGINNNDYQVKRANVLCQKAGLAKLTKAVKGDFENMPFPDASFDSAYAIEATCHARDLRNPYGEVYRVLKPGGYFACYEWLTTDLYDETNLEQKKIVHGIEEGDSIPKLVSIKECLQALKDVGYEIIEYQDLADPELAINSAQDPWYKPLKGSYSLSLDDLMCWRMNAVGRVVTTSMVWALETLRLAPPGTQKVAQILNTAADNLVAGGEQNLFTPMFFFLVRKPLDAEMDA